jgi:hypothetical protein
MRLLVGLAAVVAIVVAYVALGFAEDNLTRCPTCGLDSLVITRTSIGAATLLCCTSCGSQFRQASDGGPIVPA